MWAAKRDGAGTTSVALADVCDCTFGACTENFRKHGLQSLQTGQCFCLHIKKRTFDFGRKHPKTARHVVLAIRNLMSTESVSEGFLLWMAAFPREHKGTMMVLVFRLIYHPPIARPPYIIGIVIGLFILFHPICFTYWPILLLASR